ncbi:MAG: PTS sugar transporter subunit IIC [Elusimicrobiota bacterium]|nr:PTS sugar transporter subunit IIC [Endomicrobiia bacterium]MDW8164979.1 PTS sugar transporter subunit IIC [Elusimicrobiota bacterium]
MLISFQILIISLLAGLIHLDILVFGQFMISRPIVVGGLLGYLLGIPQYGILIGVLFELLYIVEIPVGVKVPVDATSSTIFSIVGFQVSKCLVLSIVIGFFVGFIYKYIDIISRSVNSIVLSWVDTAKDEIVIRRINLLVLYGIISTYLKTVLFYLISFSSIGFLLYEICKFLSSKIILDVNSLISVLPAIGIGICINHFLER